GSTTPTRVSATSPSNRWRSRPSDRSSSTRSPTGRSVCASSSTTPRAGFQEPGPRRPYSALLTSRIDGDGERAGRVLDVDGVVALGQMVERDRPDRRTLTRLGQRVRPDPE